VSRVLETIRLVASGWTPTAVLLGVAISMVESRLGVQVADQQVF
jgi:hypothetical protein